MPRPSAASVQSSTSYTPAHTSGAFAPVTPTPAAAIAECVSAILEGRPLPEAWRPAPAPVTTAPRTVEEGISRILVGRAPYADE